MNVLELTLAEILENFKLNQLEDGEFQVTEQMETYYER
jgi:hypothetical protein